MSETPKRDLISLVGSRICHDLISPLGAIHNGMELLELTGIPESPEMQMINQSVHDANTRIKFFRIAFGAARAGQMVAARDVAEILETGSEERRVKVDWQIEGDAERVDVKAAFLLISCLESVMPWGGQVVVSHDSGKLRVHGAADQLKVDQALWDFIRHGDTGGELIPAKVEFALIGPVLAEHGRSAEVTMSDTTITITC